MVQMKSVDQWQHVQSDNLPRFTIQGTERREVQTLGLNRDRNKSQVVNNHEIRTVNEPSIPNPQDGRGVETEIRYLNYQNVLGASTAPDSDADV